MPPTQAARKQRGAWYTPPELVDLVVDGVLDAIRPPRGRPSGCSTRRAATDASWRRRSDVGRLVPRSSCRRRHRPGCDVDADQRSLRPSDPRSRARIHADALDPRLGRRPLRRRRRQPAVPVADGGGHDHGAGRAGTVAGRTPMPRPSSWRSPSDSPIPTDGRVGLVLPQSILGSRDAADPCASRSIRLADLTWSWW